MLDSSSQPDAENLGVSRATGADPRSVNDRMNVQHGAHDEHVTRADEHASAMQRALTNDEQRFCTTHTVTGSGVPPQRAVISHQVACHTSLDLRSRGECLPRMAKSNLTTQPV